MQNSIVILASLIFQQPHCGMALPLTMNDSLVGVQNDSQIAGSTGAAAALATAPLAFEIKVHNDDVNVTLPEVDSLAVVRPEVGDGSSAVAPMVQDNVTTKAKSRNGMVRVSTIAPASYISTGLQNGGSISAQATSHMGINLREGSALMCLAVLVLWLTRNHIRTIWEETMHPKTKAQKWEASLEPAKKKTLTAYDFGTPNEGSSARNREPDL